MIDSAQFSELYRKPANAFGAQKCPKSTGSQKNFLIAGKRMNFRYAIFYVCLANHTGTKAVAQLRKRHSLGIPGLDLVFKQALIRKQGRAGGA